MRSIKVLLCLSHGLMLHASSESTVPVFRNGDAPVPIGRSSALYEDSSAVMTADQVIRIDRFTASAAEVANLPVSKSAHWIRFSIRNESREPQLLLSVPYAEIDEIDLYRMELDRPVLVARTGRSRESAERVSRDHEFMFDLDLGPGESGTYLMRVRGFKPIHVPLLVSDQRGGAKATAERNLLFGAYAGIMLVMALYNLFVFFSTRDKSYFFYVLYILAICAAQLTFLGLGPAEVFGGSAWLGARWSILFALLAVVLGMEFARRFIGTKAIVPKLHKLVPVFFVLVGLNMLLYLFGDPWLGYQVAQAITGWTALYLLVLATTAWRKGSRTAGFFLLAWVSFLVGVVIFILKDAGVLPFNQLTLLAMPIGSAVEGVLLSFALADRINTLRKEKEVSQAEALASAEENERITRDQNITLELKVNERTQQLQESLDHLKQTQSQLVEAEKMSSLGQLTAGIAHEINNPINYVRSNIPPLKRDLNDLLELLAAYRAKGVPEELAELEKRMGIAETIPEIGEILHSMEDGANRAAEIVRGLRTFSRMDEGDLKSVDLNDGVKSTLSLLGSQVKDRVKVELDLRATEVVECLPGKINQVFMNVLNNAIQAVVLKHGETGGRISVVTEQLRDHTIVTITDNGIGMDATTRARAFEPFFTTKDVGEGTGLGLSIAHSIIEKHHGTIEVDSIPGEGSAFRLILPNNQPAELAKRA